MPTTVYLGNHDAVDHIPDPASADAPSIRVPLDGKRCTTVSVPDAMPLGEAFATVTHTSLWSAHSAAATPAWVAATDDQLGRLLAAHWDCDYREVQVPSC